MDGDVDFIKQISTRFQGFIPEDPELAHVALGEFTRWLLEALHLNRSNFFDVLLPEVTSFFEQAVSKDPSLSDLLKVSFLENLHRFGPDCSKLIDGLGEKLSELREEYEKEWGPICAKS